MKSAFKVLAALLSVGLLALPTTLSGPALAGPGSREVLADTDNNPATPPVREFAGATRYETSVAAAQRYVNAARSRGNPSTTAIVASGESLIDAAGAAGLARATNAPVLLTPTGAVHAPAAHLIEREGINRVIIVGGPNAVSPEVEDTFRDLEGVQSVERIGGSDRFHTAGLIAASLGSVGDYCNSGQSSALVVNSDSVADVIIAGPVAYAFGIPILLTSTDGLPAETAAAIRQLEITQLVTLGGAVPADQLRSQLAEAGADVSTTTPIAGANSFATSVAALQALQGCLGDAFDAQSVALISNTALSDGISAAPMLGQGLRSPGSSPGSTTAVLLVGSNALPAEVENYLRSTPSAVQITAIGGLGVISANVAAAAVASANGQAIPRQPDPSFESGNAQECRLTGTYGFPGASRRTNSTGSLRISALFADFPDAAATYSTRVEDNGQLAELERYLEQNSYGKLGVRIDPLHRWLRSPLRTEWYLDSDANGGIFFNPSLLLRDAVDNADQFTRFQDGYHAVLTIHPTRLFGDYATSNYGGAIVDDNNLHRHSLIGVNRRVQALEGPQPWLGDATLAVGHNLGLPDPRHYPGAATLFETPTSSQPGREWATLSFGMGHLRGHLLVNEDDARPLSAGSREMLAWSRWRLGWLDAERVVCLTNPAVDAVDTLNLVADNSGQSMLMIPTSRTSGLVIEARRNVGYDAGTLAKEGLLIYEVNTEVSGNSVPLRFWHGDQAQNLVLSNYPILGVGETATGTLADGSRLSVNVEGDSGSGFSVRLTRG